MRRSRFLIPAAAVLATAAVAVPVVLAADAQVNTYTVSGKVTGGKGATKAKPKPISLNFDYTVGEEHGLRPSSVIKYSIFFGGGLANTTAFPGCDPDKLNAAGDLAVCPKGSLVGSGKIINEVGQPTNKADKSLYCYLVLTTVNSTKKDHLLLFLKGVQNDPDPKKTCVTQVHEAIDAKFVKKPGGTALEFTVPPNLLHPASLDNAVTQTTSVINRVTATKKGKKIGYLSSTTCKDNKTQIKVAFTQESDNSTKVITKNTTCN